MLSSTIRKVAKVAQDDPIDEDGQENESQMDEIQVKDAQSQEGHSDGIQNHVDPTKSLVSYEANSSDDSLDSSIPEYNGNIQLNSSDDEIVDLLDGNLPQFNNTDYSISIPDEFFLREQQSVADKVDSNDSGDTIVSSSTQANVLDELGN